MRSLAKALSASSCEPALLGPKTCLRSVRSASTMPSARGTSGPTTIRLMPCLSHQFVNGNVLFGSHLCGHGLPSFERPALPGSVNHSVPHRSDWRSFHASACSRPPPPMSRMLQARGQLGGGVAIPGSVAAGGDFVAIRAVEQLSNSAAGGGRSLQSARPAEGTSRRSPRRSRYERFPLRRFLPRGVPGAGCLSLCRGSP